MENEWETQEAAQLTDDWEQWALLLRWPEQVR
jgi:hypothetical protein